MANPNTGSHVPDSVQLSYQLIRNTTSPDEKASGVQSFIANLPAFEVLNVNTKDNLRSYLAEYNPRKRNRVHDAIRSTINTEPLRFITRNGGLVITVSDIHIDDKRRTITLHDASIVNGSQTQGEIRRYWQELAEADDSDLISESPFFVRAEIIVDEDPAQVVETAIARNTATPVKSISQAGARGHLDELENSIQQVRPNDKIRKSETDENVLDTRKILQWCRLLMPESISKNSTPAERLRPYKNPEQCLTDFSDWYEHRHKDLEKAVRYAFTVQIAPYALEEYEYWEAHEAWNGHKIWEQTKKGGRACRRDKKNGRVVWISPGIVYPIMGAMSEFVQRNSGHWRIQKPSRFRPDEMVARAVAQFRAHDSDPMSMGRSEGAYDALRIYPNTLVEVLKDVEGNDGV